MSSKTGMSAKRVGKELRELEKEALDGVRAGLKHPDNLFEWYAQIDGPADSVYAGGVFDIDISVPPDYPFRAPRASFRTKVYHMNINSQGAICLDILKSNWSPALSVLKVILSILSLLTDPNPADPLVGEIAQMYLRNRKQHDKTAREWTQNFAKPSMAIPPVVPAVKPTAKEVPAANSVAPSTGTNAAVSAPAQVRNAPIVIDDEASSPPPVALSTRPGLRSTGSAASLAASSSRTRSRKRGADSQTVADSTSTGETSRSTRQRTATNGADTSNQIIELD